MGPSLPLPLSGTYSSRLLRYLDLLGDIFLLKVTANASVGEYQLGGEKSKSKREVKENNKKSDKCGQGGEERREEGEESARSGD